MSENNFNFIDSCFQSKLESICFFGFFDLLLGIAFLFFNLFAFIKMTNFFHKIKFENMLILLSLVQLILFLISMIILIRILLYLFIFMQIVIITLLNYKFIKLSNGISIIKYPWINKVIIIVNIVFLLALIILYAFSLDHNYILCIYYSIELVASIILTFYCSKYLDLIKKRTEEKRQSKIRTTTLFLNLTINEEDELFYTHKKKQLIILYLSNITCTLLESCCQICITIIKSFNTKNLVIYIYCLISLFHNIIIFFIFYWMIRQQYNSTLNTNHLNIDDLDENGLIDDKFIQEEEMKIKKKKKNKKEEEDKKEDIPRTKSEFDDYAFD